jgi:hypothetical protein
VTAQVVEMIGNMKTFTTLRLAMEQHLSVVVKWKLARSYGHRVGAEFVVTAPDAATLLASIVELVACMRKITEVEVFGEPSPGGNLAPEVMGDFFRLDELLRGPLSLQGPPGVSSLQGPPGVFGWAASEELAELDEAAWVERAWPYVEQLCAAAELARKCANVQREALLNKLSRVYQKPDFCIRRDSVGRTRDRLLPPTLSWDEDWYYGGDIRLDPRPSQTESATGPDMTADPGTNAPLAQNPDELDLPPLSSR